MLILVAGLVLFLGVHLVPTLPRLRAGLLERWGEGRYKGAFSLVALAGLVLIVYGYGAASPGERLFQPSAAAIALAPYAVTLAFILFAAANLRAHIRRILKHPMLIGTALWAAIHLLANGDLRGTILFGSFLAYAAIDLVSAIRRHALRDFVPSVRHDAIAIVAGIVAALAVMALHGMLFGVVVAPWMRAQDLAVRVVAVSSQVGMMLWLV